MRSLYELCLERIVLSDIEPSGIPEEIVEQVHIYRREYPLRISFAYRWDSQSIENICKELGYPLLDEDLEQIRMNPRYWLTNESVINILCEEFLFFINYVRSEISKQVQVLAAFVHFLYKNSGILAVTIFEEAPLLKKIERFLKQILAIQGRKWFDDITVEMYDELYGCSINRIHKRECWKRVHKAIHTVTFQKAVNREFPHTIGRAFVGDLHDVRNNLYWQSEMRAVQRAQHISGAFPTDEWTWNRRFDRFGYWSEQWWFNGEIIYEEGYCDYRAGYSIDYTLKECDGLIEPLSANQKQLLFRADKPY